MAAQYFCVFASLCAAASSAPPMPPRLYQPAPAQLQNLQAIGQLEYYNDNPEPQNYYNQPLQKQGNNQNGAPSRLETLEPDSEVELLPGAQQPQQPPQQSPVAPGNGIIPGRVLIVHMPIPGYRPGTIGGYQPVYVVAAAPQGNTAYAPNALPHGYQNAVLVNPSGQVLSPFFGYPGAVQQPIAPNSGLLIGAPLQYGRDYEQLYQGQPGVPVYPYGAPGGPQGPGTAVGPQGALQFSQLVNLQGQQQANNGPRAVATEASTNTDPKRVGESESRETKEATQEPLQQEPRRNARPAPPHAHDRVKP